jgi:hypothetical protein
MDDANAEPDEWWELTKVQFQEEMQKMVAHRRDEVAYRRHLFAFKKEFLNFIYHSPNSTGLFSPLHE